MEEDDTVIAKAPFRYSTTTSNSKPGSTSILLENNHEQVVIGSLRTPIVTSLQQSNSRGGDVGGGREFIFDHLEIERMKYHHHHTDVPYETQEVNKNHQQ